MMKLLRRARAIPTRASARSRTGQAGATRASQTAGMLVILTLDPAPGNLICRLILASTYSEKLRHYVDGLTTFIKVVIC